MAKPMSAPRRNVRVRGTVQRLVSDRGFGFVRDDADGTDYFFHYTACSEGLFVELSAGRAVTFIIGESRKGPRAEAIQLAEPTV